VVSGCDQRGSGTLEELSALGVLTYVGHSPSHVRDVDVLTGSPAISSSHAEIVAAKDAQLTVLSRSEVMAQLSRDSELVGVAGTHGKTTTTSMAVHIWSAAQRDPSWLVGAPVAGLGANGHYVAGSALIAEVDESYGTFALMTPFALALTNVDPDHLDFYGDEATLRAAFVSLIERTSGPVVIWSDHEGARAVTRELTREITTVARHEGADVVVRNELFSPQGSSFTLQLGDHECDVTLGVPGALNVANAAVAGALAWRCGIESAAIVQGLTNFAGVSRRFESRGTLRGTDIVDDYAHLPAEVAATIGAARTMGYREIVAIFQPHRVTRTMALARSFPGAFDGLSELFVTNIYTSGEDNPQAVTGELVANAVAASATFPVHYVSELTDAAHELATRLGRADLILVLGAGDVDQVIDLLHDQVDS
jgi:UDP-N-acetylmuramate--alanine ligase